MLLQEPLQENIAGMRLNLFEKKKKEAVNTIFKKSNPSKWCHSTLQGRVALSKAKQNGELKATTSKQLLVVPSKNIYTAKFKHLRKLPKNLGLPQNDNGITFDKAKQCNTGIT